MINKIPHFGWAKINMVDFFFFCLRVQYGLAGHFLWHPLTSSHSDETTVSALNGLCKGDTPLLIAFLCAGEGLSGQHPRLRAGFQVTAIHELAGSPGDTLIWHWPSEWTLQGRVPKEKGKVFGPAQQRCPLLRPLLPAHRNVRGTYRVFTFLQGPISSCILKTGSLSWNITVSLWFPWIS